MGCMFEGVLHVRRAARPRVAHVRELERRGAQREDLKLRPPAVAVEVDEEVQVPRGDRLGRR